MYRFVKNLSSFFRDERGAVQVEYLVLTASLIGLCLGATNAISGALGEGGVSIVDKMQARVDAGLAGYE